MTREEVVQKIHSFLANYLASVELEISPETDLNKIKEDFADGSGELRWWMVETEKGYKYRGVDENYEVVYVTFDDDNWAYIRTTADNAESILRFAEICHANIYVNGEQIYSYD